ncbi:MFS transporter [Paenibacillus thalictri]|uniref:MFS transporter n=1 Tax=Paenibacillus thalictri TaxID=2527873 RepID=A0A4Q9DZX5_9BACL|nr:MFS transporter [Paenibacillus thalictri]
MRWYIGGLLGIGVVINFLDRTNISVAGSQMAESYGWSNVQLGVLYSAFFWTYALLQIPVGVLLDKIGVKWILRTCMTLWALATIGTSFMGGMSGVIVMRMILGAAEAPAFPASAKATGNWFPLHERGLATSMFEGAAKFANVIGIGICVWSITHWGWRGAFIVTGVINLLYAIVFWLFYRDPAEHSKLSREEREYIENNGSRVASQMEGSTYQNLLLLFGNRKVWGLSIGFASYGYTLYLFLTWLPSYMTKQLHLSLATGGWYTVIPWIVATITEIAIGGWLVDHLIRKGRNPSKVRKGILIIGMLFGVFVLLEPTTVNPNLEVAFLSIALGGLAFAASVSWSIPSIIAPQGMVGTVGSIMNFFAQLMGVAAPVITGYIIDKTGSYNSAFGLAGIILIIGILCFTFLLGDLKQIPSRPDGSAQNPGLDHGTEKASG